MPGAPRHRVHAAEFGVRQGEEHQSAAAELPGNRGRPRERGGIESAEQPAGADDRPNGREEESEGADIAPQLRRHAFGRRNQRLNQLGRRWTPSPQAPVLAARVGRASDHWRSPPAPQPPQTGSGLDQAAADRVAGEVDAVAHAELAEDVGAMGLDRFDAEDKHGCDLF